MKTLLTTIYFLVFLGFTMQSQAQTKEETISWLKEKLGKYAEGPNSFTNITLQRINECEIVFSYVYGGGEWLQILPTSIAGLTNDGAFTYTADLAADRKQGGEAKFNNVSFIKIGNREENIRSRIEKALKHLATFCPKKQEAF